MIAADQAPLSASVVDMHPNQQTNETYRTVPQNCRIKIFNRRILQNLRFVLNTWMQIVLPPNYAIILPLPVCIFFLWASDAWNKLHWLIEWTINQKHRLGYTLRHWNTGRTYYPLHFPTDTRCSENHNNKCVQIIRKSAVWNFVLYSGAIWWRRETFERDAQLYKPSSII